MHLLKNKHRFTIYLLLAFCFPCKAQCNKSYGYSYQNQCETITINQLKTAKKLTGNCYNIIGYINDVRHFYKCPKGAICKMSPPATLYISSKYPDKRDLSANLNLPFDKEDEFKKGDYGIFSFMNRRSNNPKHINSFNNRYNLIGYEIYPKP